MNFKSVVLATMLAVSASSAYAGNFVTLGSGNGTNLTSANGGIQTGTNNSNSDKFYIQTTSATYVSGYGIENQNTTGDIVAQTINYRSFSTVSPRPTINTGTLTLLDWRVTRGVDLAPGSQQADIFDFVYQDSFDGKLVFGTRYLNRQDNNEEANYLYRYGFTGFTTEAAWTFSSDYDLRLYQAAKTDDHSYNASVLYDADVVRQKGDFSVSEGNPWSGLFLVKTDAQYYTLGEKAIGYYQAGEEGQAVVGGYIGGFVASATMPVPEPETYGMMLAGLAFIGVVARRRI